MKKQILVITDLDGTLTNKSLVLEHCGFLEKNGIIDTHGAYQNWKADMKNEKLIVECAIAYQSALKGKTLEDMRAKEFCMEFLQNENNWYDTILELEGRQSYIISGSADFLVRALCAEFRQYEQYERVYGMGSKYEIVDNVFTGKIIVPMFSADTKRQVIKTLVHDDVYVIGMGDTSSDFPILERADYSILVEPTEKTMKEVLKNKIKIDRLV